MICFFFLKKTTTTTTHSQINIKNKREVLLVKNQNKTKYASGLWLVFFFFLFHISKPSGIQNTHGQRRP